MQPDDRDAGRLWDMLFHAREIVQTLSGIRFAPELIAMLEPLVPAPPEAEG